jgi:Rrf2 family protein
MKLSKTSAHAALAMAFVARQPGGNPVQARQVAEHLGVPTDSALKVLQALSRTGLMQSQLGRGGGYRIERPPRQVTLLEIVEAIDGPIGGRLPLQLSGGGGLDVLRDACEQAAASLRSELQRFTVADLIGGDAPGDADTPAAA